MNMKVSSMNLFYKIRDYFFGHTHDFEFESFVYHSSENYHLSGMPNTAKVYRCRCGMERRKLTPSGAQQICDFGDDIAKVMGQA